MMPDGPIPQLLESQLEQTGPARLLIVDDSPVCRASLRAHLASIDCLTDEAGDGLEALKRLERESYDVVVSDLAMPGLDGFGLLEAIRSQPCPPEVVLLTGADAGDQESAIRALRLGAHDYLLKPLRSGNSVRLAVARALQTKRLRAANSRMMEELAGLARTDPLTGLFNRRAFDDCLSREIARANRHSLPLSLALLDLDHFKRVNDAHGHAAGDLVLRVFAGIARDLFREPDAVFRVGGDEFAVVLAHASMEGALEAVCRLLAAVRTMPIHVGEVTLWLTASAGVAQLDNGQAAGSWVARADDALYRAKAAGRDQVSFEPSMLAAA